VGTIVSRERKDGSTAYMAQIVLYRDGKIAHREAKTFDRKPAAVAWIKKRETELSKPGAVLGAASNKRSPTLANAIDRYIAESRRELGRTKKQVLKAIKAHEIADLECANICSQHIIEFAQTLAVSCKPQTVANYLSHLAAVFRIARPAWRYELDQQAMKDAFVVATRLGLTGKSDARERRPTLSELDLILGYFREKRIKTPQSSPMAAIIAFAIFSTRRQEEIVQIEWRDLDREGKRILVRDMKHPGEKIGNDVWCDLPDPALCIVEAMPRKSERIFPYSTDAVSAAFTRACKFLGVEDLHFHDMRHDGISRLFEMGLSIPRVAEASGHRSWQSLKRYTHLRQTGDKYADWRWVGIIVSDLKMRSSKSI
jgi:integrase